MGYLHYKKLVNLLQRIESDIFIDMICKELVEVDIVPLTIHDCIIVKESELTRSELTLKRVLTDCLGFTPKAEPEALNELEFKV